jgi:hypothetical protein
VLPWGGSRDLIGLRAESWLAIGPWRCQLPRVGWDGVSRLGAGQSASGGARVEEAECRREWQPAATPRSWCAPPAACAWCRSTAPSEARSAWRSRSGSRTRRCVLAARARPLGPVSTGIQSHFQCPDPSALPSPWPLAPRTLVGLLPPTPSRCSASRPRLPSRDPLSFFRSRTRLLLDLRRVCDSAAVIGCAGVPSAGGREEVTRSVYLSERAPGGLPR